MQHAKSDSPDHDNSFLPLINDAAKTSYTGVCRIGAADLRVHAPCYRRCPPSLIRIRRVRKFFGRSTGSSPKPQQSKLAFQKPHTTKSVKDESEVVNKTVKTEDREEADAVKNETDNEDVNMDSDSEVHKPIMDSKRADPVVKGIDDLDSARANNKGKLSIPDLQLKSVY